MSAVDIAARGLAGRALAQQEDLAAETGAASIGTRSGASVQDAIGFETVAEMLASKRPARGEGCRWKAGGFRYRETAGGSDPYHVRTAGGVGLLVEPQVPHQGYHAGAFGALTMAKDAIGDAAAEAANAAINNVAIQKAFDAASDQRWSVLFDAGTYCYSAEFTSGQPIGVIGRGWASTVFQPTRDYSGWLMGFTDVTYNWGDAARDYRQDRSALRLRDFSVQAAGRSTTCKQHGIRFIGRCDRMIMDSVFFGYLAGTALHFGHMNGKSTTIAYARECMISNVEARFCGDNDDERPVIVFENYGTQSGQDGSNLCVCNRLWVAFPYHTGLKLANNNPAGAQVRKMAFNNTVIHGAASWEPNPVTTAPLIHIVGKTLLCVFRDLWFNSHYAGQYGVVLEANASGTPSLISFDGGNISTGAGHGFKFDSGYGYNVDFQLWGQSGTGITVGPNVSGPISIGQNSGQVPSTSIAPGLEKLINAGSSGTASLPFRSEKFVVGPHSTSPVWTYSVGSPEGSVTAPPGSICSNMSAGGLSNSLSLFVKRGGGGNTNWFPVQEVVGGPTAARPTTPTANQSYADTDRERMVSFITGAWREPVRWVNPPAAANSAGKAGDLAADAGYLYLCHANNAWRRVATGSW